MTAPKIGNQNTITPDPGISVALADKDLAAFNASPLPASAAWLYSEGFSVAAARFLTLDFLYNAHASTTTGQAKVRILFSNSAGGTGPNGSPLFSADEWFEAQLPNDLNGTAAALTGALGTGFDASAGPLRNVRTILGGTFLLPAAVANSDKIRQSVVLRVDNYRWCLVAVQELVDQTNRGTVSIMASLTA